MSSNEQGSARAGQRVSTANADAAPTEETQKAIDRLWSIDVPGGVLVEVEHRAAVDRHRVNGVELVGTPELVRVVLKLHPTAHSDITVELWLPVTEWDGNFLGTGNGGAAGAIVEVALINGSSMGFAVANTDMGTTADALEMVGSFDRIADFGGRATHLMTVVSKQLITEFYGRAPHFSYFLGGSTGGQQGLREAQDYPEDYDGIIAVGPANNRVALHTSFVWNWQATTADGSALITPEQAKAFTARLVAEYGEEAGCAPGDDFLPYPNRVTIDWDALSDALPSRQMAAMRTVIEGPTDPATGERLFAPYLVGSDLGLWYTDPFGRDELLKLFFPFQWLWGRAFDVAGYDFHEGHQHVVAELGALLDATSPDLTRFRERGGKMMLIAGTADSIIPFSDTESYYESIVDHDGGLANVLDYCRCFLVPGFGHTLGGPGFQDIGTIGIATVPFDAEHNPLLAMKAWVQEGRAPERILPVAFEGGQFGGTIVAERPVYPYPTTTEYIAGDPSRAESYGPSEV